MRKLLSILTLVVILMMAITSVAAAKIGVGNPKGVIDEIVTEADGTVLITLLLEDETDPLVITMPEGFDLEAAGLEVGMLVVAKGEWTEEGFNADWVKEAEEDDEEEPEEVEEPEETEEPEEEEGEEGDGEGNAWGQGGVFCAEGGKDKVHPVAQKIADKYEVDPEWVMSYACDGHGFGGVMLALQTAAANEGGDADAYLAKRKEGKGWGQIWKEDGLTKNDKADNPPPGHLKKPDKVRGPKDTPPGQSNKPDKNKDWKTDNPNKPTKTPPEDDSDGE